MNEVSTGKIWRLQRVISQMPQLELPTEHYFADGMYARVLKRPAGTLIVGKVHKREHFYIVTKGRVEVASDEGTKTYEAGDVIVSKPGTKRAVLALEDSICMTVHRTRKRNLDRIEKELVEEDKTALYDARNKLLPRRVG
jgi:mannose-6-phosphate isomerase-like protein (cupin superfamily)